MWIFNTVHRDCLVMKHIPECFISNLVTNDFTPSKVAVSESACSAVVLLFFHILLVECAKLADVFAVTLACHEHASCVSHLLAWSRVIQVTHILQVASDVCCGQKCHTSLPHYCFQFLFNPYYMFNHTRSQNTLNFIYKVNLYNKL